MGYVNSFWHFNIGILSCISRINRTSDCLEQEKLFFMYLSFYEQLKFHAQLTGLYRAILGKGLWPKLGNMVDLGKMPI